MYVTATTATFRFRTFFLQILHFCILQAQGEQVTVDIRSKFLTEAERQHIDALLLTNRSIVGAIGKVTGETKRRQRGICFYTALYLYLFILVRRTHVWCRINNATIENN